jgi:hypothetical protein
MATLSTVLSRYGLLGRITASIEPHRNDQGNWGIKFSAPGDPAGFQLILVVHQSSLRNSEALLRRLLPSG